MSVNSVNVTNSVQPKYEKSKNGKLMGGLAGTALAAGKIVCELDSTNCAYEIANRAGFALNSLKEPFDYNHNIYNNLLQSKSSQKHFIKKASKIIEKYNNISLGAFVIFSITAGLTIGAVVDAIVNGVRNKKANKTQTQQKLDVVQ